MNESEQYIVESAMAGVVGGLIHQLISVEATIQAGHDREDTRLYVNTLFPTFPPEIAAWVRSGLKDLRKEREGRWSSVTIDAINIVIRIGDEHERTCDGHLGPEAYEIERVIAEMMWKRIRTYEKNWDEQVNDVRKQMFGVLLANAIAAAQAADG